MKKYVRILIASGLLMSAMTVSVPTNEVMAKESAKVQTSSVAKNKILLGLKGKESIKTVKKLGKKKGWKYVGTHVFEQTSSVKFMTFKNVSILGKKQKVEFCFLDGKLIQISTYNEYKKKTVNDVKKYHTSFYNKVKKDLGNKKGKTEKVSIKEDGKPYYEMHTDWAIKKPSKVYINYSIYYDGMYSPKKLTEGLTITFGKEFYPVLSVG